MPKYIANAYIVHNGKVVPIGDELELTKVQGERLGDKVKPANPKKETPKETKAKKESK